MPRAAIPQPVDPNKSMNTQALKALELGEELGLLAYHRPVDLTLDAAVRQLRADLGPGAVLPKVVNSLYYLVYIESDAGERFPMLWPEQDVRAYVMALAARRSLDTARSVSYREGILPRP